MRFPDARDALAGALLAAACAASAGWLFSSEIDDQWRQECAAHARSQARARAAWQDMLGQGVYVLAQIASSAPENEWPQLANSWSSAYGASVHMSGGAKAHSDASGAPAFASGTAIVESAQAGLGETGGPKVIVWASLPEGSAAEPPPGRSQSHVTAWVLGFALAAAAATWRRGPRRWRAERIMAASVLGACVACAAMPVLVSPARGASAAHGAAVASPSRADATRALARFGASLPAWRPGGHRGFSRVFAIADLSASLGDLGGVAVYSKDGALIAPSGGGSWISRMPAPEASRVAARSGRPEQSSAACGFLGQPCLAYAQPTPDGHNLVVFDPVSGPKNAPPELRLAPPSILPPIGACAFLGALGALMRLFLRQMAAQRPHSR
jgi:hypothetical protein